MEEKKNAGNHHVPLSQQPFLCYQRSLSPARWHGKHTYLSIRITSVNSTNQASDVTRHNSADSVPTSNLVCIKEVAIRSTFCIAGINLLHLQLSY